jgi:hypothetical protein
MFTSLCIVDEANVHSGRSTKSLLVNTFGMNRMKPYRSTQVGQLTQQTGSSDEMHYQREKG